MNKKDLIQLIKTKANEVEIKDLSETIKYEASKLPVIPVQKTRHTFDFRWLRLGLSTAMTAVIVVFIFIFAKTDPVYAFEDLDQALMESTLTSLSVLSDEDPLNAPTSESLVMSMLELDQTTIDTEMNQLLRYLQATELILGQHQLTKTTIVDDQLFQLSFEATDLLDVQYAYQLTYELNERVNNQQEILGSITYETHTYEFIARIQYQEHSELTLVLQNDSNQTVESTYQYHEDGYRYQLNVYQDQVKTQSVSILNRQVNARQRLIIDFTEGTASGSYAIGVEEVAGQKRLHAQYFILNNNDEGDIYIETDPEGDYYNISVYQAGGASTTIQVGRRRVPPTPMTPGHHGNF